MANAELAVTILGAQTGFQNLVTQSDPVSQINNIGQLAAGLASLVGNPQAILASNTAASVARKKRSVFRDNIRIWSTIAVAA